MAKKKNINDMNIDELKVELKNLSDSGFNINFRKSLHQLEDTAIIKKTKKNIARIKTFIRQYEMDIKK